jgi:pilus assembly protein CpaC
MSTGEGLKDVLNQDPNVAKVAPMRDDLKKVLVTGLKVGITRVTLIDVKNNREVVDVVVQPDVEHLRNVLRQTVPTANVQLTPASENTIVMSGTASHAEDIDVLVKTAQSLGFQVINTMRVGGVMQVQLDVVMANVSRSELRRMAFDFIEAGQHHIFTSTVGGALTLPSAGLEGSLLGNPIIRNTVGQTQGAFANGFLGVFNDEQAFFGFLQALRDEGLSKLLSEPRIVTLSGRPATINSGGEVPVVSANGLGTTSVIYKRIGTVVTFLPIVMGDGKINLQVTADEISLDPANSSGGNVGFDTQHVDTAVQLEDGQTLAVGGLVKNTINGATTKWPILGDLPFIGAAFSRKTYSEVETELVFMVTVHLVDPMACNQLPKVLPGQETRTPDDFELFLEGILEAPRGPREVCPGGHYLPAYKNGPTANIFPCVGNGSCNGSCNGGCGDSHGACQSCPAAQANGAVPVSAPAESTETKQPIQPVGMRSEQPAPSGEGNTPVQVPQGSEGQTGDGRHP